MLRIWRIGRRVLPWLLVLALISRRIDQFITPQFWAEDGSVFFSDAFSSGCATLFHPYGGYLHLVPRLVATFCAGLPWEWTPLAYNLAALTIWTLILWRIGTARLPAAFRWLAAASMVLSLHSGEVFLNITQLQRPLAFILAVNLLEPVPRSTWETGRLCAEVLLAGLSCPLILVALVGVLARIFSWLRRREGTILLIAYGTAATIQFLALSSGEQQTGGTAWGSAIELLKVLPVYVSYLSGVGFFPGCSACGMMLVGLAWGILVAALILRGLKRKDRYTALVIFVCALGCLATGRIRRGIWVGPFDIGNARYTYISYVLFAWMLAWIASRGVSRAVRIAGASLVFAAFLSCTVHWSAYDEPDYRWCAQVAEARSGGRRFFLVPPDFRFPVPLLAKKQDKPPP